MREPQHYANYCKINVNQDIETTLKQDKSEGVMHGPLGPTVAMPVWLNIVYKAICNNYYTFVAMAARICIRTYQYSAWVRVGIAHAHSRS